MSGGVRAQNSYGGTCVGAVFGMGVGGWCVGFVSCVRKGTQCVSQYPGPPPPPTPPPPLDLSTDGRHQSHWCSLHCCVEGWRGQCGFSLCRLRVHVLPVLHHGQQHQHAGKGEGSLKCTFCLLSLFNAHGVACLRVCVRVYACACGCGCGCLCLRVCAWLWLCVVVAVRGCGVWGVHHACVALSVLPGRLRGDRAGDWEPQVLAFQPRLCDCQGREQHCADRGWRD